MASKKTKRRRVAKTRNPMARAVRTPQYKQRVRKNKKKENSKNCARQWRKGRSKSVDFDRHYRMFPSRPQCARL